MSWIQQFDEQAVLFISEHMQWQWLDGIMIFVSSLGNKGMIFLLFAAIMILRGNKPPACWLTRGVKLLFCLGGTALFANVLLKPGIARSRPFDLLKLSLLIEAPHDFSFPSGHTAAAFATAVVFFTFGWKWGVVMLSFAILMAVSRLYLLVHFPSDVIAGAFLGTIVSVCILLIWEKIQVRKL